MKKSLMLILALTLVPSLASAANYGQGLYGDCEYGTTCNISITTSGTVILPATTNPSGVITVDKDLVTVSTNSSAGYTLSLESASATTNALEGATAVIPAVSATAGSPTLLNMNEWGYRIDGVLGFGAGPTTTVASQPSSALVFAGVPLLGSQQNIKVTSTSALSGDVTEVWYGVRADSSKPAGAYTSLITYTAVVN